MSLHTALERLRAEVRAVEAGMVRTRDAIERLAAAADADPKATPDRRTLSRVWSADRDALLDAEYHLGDHAGLLARINALPHYAPVRSVGAMIQRACSRGLRIAPEVKAEVRREVGRKIAVKRSGVRSPIAARPITWVGRRAEMLLEYPTAASLKDLLARINAEPGPPITPKALQAAALKRGLKRDDAAMRRSISEARRARPVAPPPRFAPPPPPPPPPFDPNAPVVNPLRLKIETAMQDGIRDWTAWSIKRNAPLREVLRIVGEIKRERDGE